MIAELNNVCKYFGADLVFNGISFSVESDSRIGLIGVNGCGKTTLLNIISGGACDDGQVSFARGTDIGYLRQNELMDSDRTIYEEMSRAFPNATSYKNKMTDITAKLNSGDLTPDESKKLSDEFSRIEALYSAAGGYEMDYRIEMVLNGMGFKDVARNSIISHMSGGEKTRLALCKFLIQSPRLLLLDEPTNHLDFETLMWLEEYLKSYKGAIIVVSHDRYFLDAVVTEIVEIADKTCTRYPGNYSKFRMLKEAAAARAQKEYEQYEKEREKLQTYVDKNLVRASSSNMAKSRRTALEKMEAPKVISLSEKSASFSFTYDSEPYTQVLDIKGLSVSVGKEPRMLINDLSMTLNKGDKLGIIGPNGIGKTTLLRALLGEHPYKGSVRWGSNTKISYYDQGNLSMNSENTVFDEFHERYPHMDNFEVRSALARVLISGDDIEKKVGSLSGGEKARLRFSIMSFEKANVLILDEPTNHLDLYTREALEKALSEYAGTIIFVSHDRYLLGKVADKILDISSPEHAVLFDEGYAKYAEHLRISQAVPAAIPSSAAVTNGIPGAKASNKQERAARAQKRQKISDAEKKIAELENESKSIAEELMELTNSASNDYKRMEYLYERDARLGDLISEAYAQWESLMEEE